ncbi:conserved exported hypothetical protein [Burkholderia sp. 8Y]|uniref:DUF4148 domain-containing protein n=1 Tax=Burkholderia sp. 8Y TaxID=2653133 RepID=UPI0012F14FCC|nr:DUF4148 domain-containing protein [Burkholderia sp. 8Y]VXB22795.1 conserved exported hypothetical protein [Burkholderia sp. 8Y]
MKLVTRIVAAALIASPLASPLAALAQEGLTRDQVKQDLQQVEQAGYQPSARDAFYPNDIQAAEARVHSGTAYGASPDGTSASGHTTSNMPSGQTPQ